MQLSNILIAPLVTEKSTKAQGTSKYTFRVNQAATKNDVARAINKTYGVDVVSVNIVPILKKQRFVGRSKVITKRRASKKAIVTVKAKQSIDFNKIKTSK